jgi:hypothetical protein
MVSVSLTSFRIEKDITKVEKLLNYLNDEEEWLYADGINANHNTLKNKLRTLERKINPIKKERESVLS